MNRRAVQLAAAAILAPATLALGQPTITSLGGGIPLMVTNDISGTRYIAGYPYGSAVGAGRWTLTGPSLVFSNPAGSNGGSGSRMSADGRYQTGTVLNSPQFSGNAATGVTPPFSLTPTLVPTAIAATEHRAARWDSTTGTWSREVNQLGVFPNQMIYGQGAAGGGTMLIPHAISANGRFIVGRSYISNYNSSAGTTIAVSTFTWRPFIWDAEGNSGAGSITPLITQMRTSTNTWRRRTGEAYAVSNDGLVVLGFQEHNVAGGADGAAPIVWRWNPSTSTYDDTFLPNPSGGSGSPGTWFMNPAGTIIAGVGPGGPSKWVWNSGTSTWDGPTVLGTFTGSSWLPTNFGYGGPILAVLGMSDDGNTVVGSVRYSNGSFIQGGWIWTAGAPTSGNMVDWYDFLASQNAAGTAPGPTSNYGPTGFQQQVTGITCSGGVASATTSFDHGMTVGNLVLITGNTTSGYNGLKTVTGVPSTTTFEFSATCDVDGNGGIVTNYSRGMPRLGNPDGVSADGTAVVGHQGGTSIIIGAMPWIVDLAGTSPCVAPAITTTPASTTFNFSRCNRFVNITVTAQGTNPTFQWYRLNGGSPIALADGVTGSGMGVIGATFPALSLSNPTPSDADTYYCVVSNSCGSVNSANFTVQVDPTIPALTAPAFGSCAAADASAGIGTGTYAFNPCGSFDTPEAVSCITAPGVLTQSAVWFKYVPAADGEARFQTCLGGYDSNITLWSACGAQLACNDDVGSGVPSCSSTRSRIARINVFNGVPVLVRVAGTGTALSATGSLQIIQPAPARPANDDCSNATVVTIPTPIAQVAVNAAPIAYDLTEATDDGAASCSATSFRSVWYSFTPAHRGVIRVSTCTASPQVDTVLSIQRGSCFSPIELACNDNQTGAPAPCGSSQSVIDNFTVTNLDVGAPLYFRVAQKNLSTTLTGQFSFRFTTTCPADYDGDGSITPADVASFVNAWFASLTAGNLAGDFDGNGSVNPADVAAFVNAWFAALSNPC